jgi:hypothetical protein
MAQPNVPVSKTGWYCVGTMVELLQRVVALRAYCLVSGSSNVLTCGVVFVVCLPAVDHVGPGVVQLPHAGIGTL